MALSNTSIRGIKPGTKRVKVRAACNHAEHMPERRKMMQAWAGYPDALRAGADVLPIKRKVG